MRCNLSPFAKPLHFLCKKANLVVLGGDIVAFALSFCDFLSCLDAKHHADTAIVLTIQLGMSIERN